MFHIIDLEPTDNDGKQPQSSADTVLSDLRRAQQVDLHLNSVFLGYLGGSRTIMINAMQLAEDIFGEQSQEHKQVCALIRHLDKVIGVIDHKIKVD